MKAQISGWRRQVSREGFAIEQALAATEPDAAYFWATYQGAAVDLILEKNGRLLGIECKRADAPRRTESMTIALQDVWWLRSRAGLIVREYLR